MRAAGRDSLVGSLRAVESLLKLSDYHLALADQRGCLHREEGYVAGGRFGWVLSGAQY